MTETSAPAAPEPPRAAKRGFLSPRLKLIFNPLSWRMGLWPALALTAVVLVFVLCAVLWRFESLRPYLATLGAAAAAFLGPLPGLLTPETRGKWLFAITTSTLITAGTWFAVKNLDDTLAITREQLGAMRERAQSFETRLNEQSSITSKFLNDRDAQLKDQIFLALGPFYRNLFRQKKWQTILDSTLTMLEVRPTNGHALYFSGESYRNLGRREDMRGMFLNYEAAANDIPASRVGAAGACYDRQDGYCAERLAWILHLMADDYFAESKQLTGTRRHSALTTALGYELKELRVRKTGFFARDGAASSCALLRLLKQELQAIGESPGDLSAPARDLEERCVLT